MTKTAIITGANKGIGLAVAKRLIQHDYRVVLACRNTEKGLMAEKYLGPSSKFLKLDLSDPESIQLFVQKIKSDYSNLCRRFDDDGTEVNDSCTTGTKIRTVEQDPYVQLRNDDTTGNAGGNIPIEFIMRNIATGSLTKRFGIEDGTVLDEIIPGKRIDLKSIYG